MSPCAAAASSQCSRDLKGKGRAVEPQGAALYSRDGDEDGVVLPLSLIQTTAYET